MDEKWKFKYNMVCRDEPFTKEEYGSAKTHHKLACERVEYKKYLCTVLIL